VTTEGMKTYLFINPGSGRHSAHNSRSVLDRLNAIGHSPEVFTVRTPADVLACCARVRQSNAPCLVVVAAGDGTFNAVVNGLQPGMATLAVLPLGTSNVLAAELGITSVEDGITRIAAGKTKPLSVGLLELEDTTRRFVLMAGIGLDGAVVRDVRPIGKRFLKQGAYALSALGRALSWDAATFEAITSDRAVSCHTLIVCNASRYGGNFILSPGSSPFSDGLTAICITGNQRRTYLRLAHDLFRGKAGENRDLIRLPVTTIRIKGKKPIQIDGDFIGYGPAQLSALPDFARIIV